MPHYDSPELELEALRHSLVESAIEGVEQIVNGEDSLRPRNPLEQLELLERLEKRQIAQTGDVFKTLRHRKLISQGGGD